MAFTEFTIRAGGSNMNSGCLNSNVELPTTPVYSATNGAWSGGTRIFTPTSGNPSLSVTIGDFAHVFLDGGTTPTYISRVTGVTSTTITMSLSNQVGVSPTAAGSGVSINVGGAWAGPSGSVVFPFNLVGNALSNIAGYSPRFNFKNDQTYNMTVSIANAVGGSVTWQGYTSTFGDFGKFTIDAGGNAIVIMNSTGAINSFLDMIVQNNGTTNVNGVNWANGRGIFARVIAHDIGGVGISASNMTLTECEAYNCNLSNTSASGAISAGVVINCIAHDNPGSNSSGFINCPTMINCIAESNGQHGINFATSNLQQFILNCDVYNNGGSGFQNGGNANGILIRNSNFIKNALYGINPNNASTSHYRLENNGYGSGTMANTLGPVGAAAASTNVTEIGAVTYGANLTPWVDPANGDFSLNLAAANNAGRSAFQQTAPSYAGTVGYPDIGSAPNLDTAPLTVPGTPIVPTLVTLNAPMYWPGHGNLTGSITYGVSTSITTAGHYLAYVFEAKEDMVVSHVLYRCGTSTTAPSVEVRIETVATTGFPSGTLVNTAGSGSTVTHSPASGTDYILALGATATIPRGTVFCLRFNILSGAAFGISRVQSLVMPSAPARPYEIVNTGTPTRAAPTLMPVGFGSSATTFYQVPFAVLASNTSATTFNSTTAAGTKRGMRFILPFTARVIGFRFFNGGNIGDFNAMIADDSGAEVSNSSTAIDGDQSSANNSGMTGVTFDNAVTCIANTPYRLTLEPTTSSNINLSYVTFSSSLYRQTSPGGNNIETASYTTAGGWTDGTLGFPILDLTIDQVYDGVSIGGGGPVGDIKMFGRGAPY